MKIIQQNLLYLTKCCMPYTAWAVFQWFQSHSWTCDANEAPSNPRPGNYYFATIQSTHSSFVSSPPPPTIVKIDVILLLEGTICRAMCKSPAGFLFLVSPTVGVIWCHSTTWWNCLYTQFKAEFLLPVSSTAGIILSYSTTWSNWLPHTVRSTCRIPKCWQSVYYVYVYIYIYILQLEVTNLTIQNIPCTLLLSAAWQCNSDLAVSLQQWKVHRVMHKQAPVCLPHHHISPSVQNVLKVPHKLWIYIK
jgi:hypothetical protein